MYKSIKLYFSLFIIGLLISCDNSVDSNKLKGQWVIEEIKYNNTPFKNHLLSNVFILKDDNKIFIPETHSFKNNTNPVWHLIKTKNRKYIEINTSNLVFKGKFEYIINKSTNGLSLELKSNSTYIRAYKLLSHVSW